MERRRKFRTNSTCFRPLLAARLGRFSHFEYWRNYYRNRGSKLNKFESMPSDLEPSRADISSGRMAPAFTFHWMYRSVVTAK